LPFFNRSVSAIDTQINRVCINRGIGGGPLPKGFAVCKCMPCSKSFMSAGPGNRICRRCSLKIEAGQMECA
jgi:hypothetical protein